jgi:hypothetical protein
LLHQAISRKKEEGKYMVGRKMWKNERRGNAEKDCVCIGR